MGKKKQSVHCDGETILGVIFGHTIPDAMLVRVVSPSQLTGETMLFIFPLVVAGMMASAIFIPAEKEQTPNQKDTKMYLVCDTVGDNCHWIEKERICDE